VFDGQILVVLVLFSFCGVSESGGRGLLLVAPPAFMAVSMVISTPPLVLVVCTAGLVLTRSTMTSTFSQW
jgi:hypothetical protein